MSSGEGAAVGAGAVDGLRSTAASTGGAANVGALGAAAVVGTAVAVSCGAGGGAAVTAPTGCVDRAGLVSVGVLA